jgi:nucleoside-diphosphate-sugar epimerase
MRIVVLGATGFLSSAVVDAALSAGHDVIAVSRGHQGEPPPGTTWVRADRDDVVSLAGAMTPYLDTIDSVIDCSGFTVQGAIAAAAVFKGVPHYVYVSSISAYRNWPPGPIRGEEDELAHHDDDLTQYGPMKAESERILRSAVGKRLLAVRAGIIIGPGDDTHRMTTWLHRIATEEWVGVPAARSQPIAVIDVRDLASWMVTAAEELVIGPLNATGPEGMCTFGEALEACADAVRSTGREPAQFVNLHDAEMRASGVTPWSDLPFVLPGDVAHTVWQVDTARARELAVPVRPISESVADTWAWQVRANLRHPPVPAVVRELTERKVAEKLAKEAEAAAASA